MCFGMQDSKKTSTNYTPNSAVAGAATQNLDFAQNLQTQGFSPYSGNQVANFSPLQSASFDQASQMINGGPQYSGQAHDLINNYSSAPAGNVSANTISSQMSPYMNQYVNLALQPQLEAQNQQFAGQNRSQDAGATMAGAFGNDAQAAIGRTNLTNQQNIARQGLIGNAYNSAFNTAIGAGAQDVSNNLNAQTTNQNLRESSLNRQMTGAQGLEGLGNYGMGVTNFANQMGGQQTAQQQAGLNAAYNQWLMAQQYPFMASQNMNQAVGAGAAAMPASNTQTTQTPNNSGWALAGALGGMALAPFTGGLSLGMTGAALGGMSGGDSGSSGGKGGGGFF